MNFWRQVRRSREMSHWNPIDPQVYGGITQSGYLKGLKDVKSPLTAFNHTVRNGLC